MELETEIPIWYDGRVKWISNLTSRSTCRDVIKAILSLDCSLSDVNETNVLYECWRGVERPLKCRCRLLKLWNSWGGESENVILTLRSRSGERIPQHFVIRQQENKLNKLKRQLKRIDKQIQKFDTINKSSIENENNKLIFNISHSILDLNNQINLKEKLILHLTNQIEYENKQDSIENHFSQLLADVNQTLIFSRILTEESDQLDQQINQINRNIDQNNLLLDELELDCALEDNIDMDSLDDIDIDQNIIKQISPSPPPILPIKTFKIQSRPTAIVEPSLSTFVNTNKSKESSFRNKTFLLSSNNLLREESLSFKSKKHFIQSNFQDQSSTNDESDTGISSFHSNDEQLVTLV